MNGAPKISVIIPVYNGEKFISEAIQSVVNQTLKPFEIIIVDDGSTDSSSKIINAFPEVSYYFKPNTGLASTLNFGLQKVKGDYIAFLDADDYWSIDKLEKQFILFETDSDLDLVFGCHQRFYSKPSNEITAEERLDMTRVLPGYFKAALLVKKKAFFKVGLFDETIVMGDFLDWYSRAVDMNLRMKMISDVVLFRRIHEDNMSTRNKSQILDYVKIMKASMDRRRSNK